MKVFASWSGGKESALATYRATSQGYQVAYLVNFISEDGKRSRSHGIPSSVMALQAKATGIPLIQVKTSWEHYEENFKKTIAWLKGKGITGGIFGDIDLEEHKDWVERVCAELGITPLLPLWGAGAEELLAEFFGSSFKATVVATTLDKSLLGKSLNMHLLNEIRKFGCHPCGEAGEYHTFVTDGPIFNKPINITQGKKEQRNNVWFIEISAKSK